MTIAYPRALAAIKADSGRQMLACFEGLTPTEMVELGTFIGPTRLKAIRMQSAGPVDLAALAARTPPAFACAARTLAVKDVIAETSYQAFNDGLTCFDRGKDPGVVAHSVTVGLADVAERRKKAPLLTIDADPTGTLPATPGSAPAPLSDQDYAESARRNNVEAAAIKAVAQQESGGRTGFLPDGRPKVRFEGHYFRRLTHRRFDRTHPHLSHPYHTNKKNPYRNWNQWERLFEAIILEEDAALMSASWGKFQVMGQFHDGWPNVRSFVAAMYVSEANHLKSFEAHAGASGMSALRRHDWTAFGNAYNGAAQAGYDTSVGRYFTAAGGKPLTPKAPHR